MPGRDLPDLEERLRRLPAALTVEAPAGLAERVARRGSRRRRLRRVTAAALAVAVVGVAVGTRSTLLDDTPTPVLGPFWPGQVASPRQLADGRWQALPSVPAGMLARRSDVAVVWTGRQLIVWGGANTRGSVLQTFVDGAAYDPRRGRWELLPPAPEHQWLRGLGEGNPVAVWTGREMLLWGGMTITDPVGAPNRGYPADGLAYDPERRTWRRLPTLPMPLTRNTGDKWVVWTGRELLVGEVRETVEGGRTVAAAYDPAANRWRPLPPSPALTRGTGHLRARTAMWAGTRLLVWNYWSATARSPFDETGVADRPEERPDGIDLWAYDPATDRWTVLPDPPGQVRRAAANSSMVWTGREVVAAAVQPSTETGQTGWTTVAGRYDPDRARWTPIAPPPIRGGRVLLAWTGAAVVDLNRNAVHDPATDGWLRLPAEPEPAGHPPSTSWGPERALLRIEERGDGAIDVYVLVAAVR